LPEYLRIPASRERYLSALERGTIDTIIATLERAERDVWAVGKTPTDQALVEHWNGQRWSSIPHSQHQTATLNGVSIAEGTVCVVGNAEESNSNGHPSRTGAFVESSW
jgi:phosphoribosylformylglycinamidine (FGAM) synthase-like enzyme